MSLSSEKSLPLTFGNDGKARIRPGNRFSLNVSKAFPGLPSFAYQPRHSLNEQQSHSSESQQNGGDDVSIGDNSSGKLKQHNIHREYIPKCACLYVYVTVCIIGYVCMYVICM